MSVWEDLPSACRDADVVVTVTLSVSTVVQGAWLKEGAIVIGERAVPCSLQISLAHCLGCSLPGVGACRPDWQELDADLMQNAVVVVDSRASAMVESGDLILSNVR